MVGAWSQTDLYGVNQSTVFLATLLLFLKALRVLRSISWITRVISSVGKQVAIIPRDWELEALLIFMEVSSSFGGGGGRLSYLSVDIFISLVRFGRLRGKEFRFEALLRPFYWIYLVCFSFIASCFGLGGIDKQWLWPFDPIEAEKGLRWVEWWNKIPFPKSVIWEIEMERAGSLYIGSNGVVIAFPFVQNTTEERKRMLSMFPWMGLFFKEPNYNRIWTNQRGLSITWHLLSFVVSSPFDL